MDRIHAFRIASGSDDEVRGVLDLAETWRYTIPSASRLDKLDQQAAILWSVAHDQRNGWTRTLQLLVEVPRMLQGRWNRGARMGWLNKDCRDGTFSRCSLDGIPAIPKLMDRQG